MCSFGFCALRNQWCRVQGLAPARARSIEVDRGWMCVGTTKTPSSSKEKRRVARLEAVPHPLRADSGGAAAPRAQCDVATRHVRSCCDFTYRLSENWTLSRSLRALDPAVTNEMVPDVRTRLILFATIREPSDWIKEWERVRERDRRRWPVAWGTLALE